MTTPKDKPPISMRFQQNIGQALPILKLDPDKYRDRISEYYPTEEQQNEVLQILWDIMSMMVDIGWGVDSVQILLPDLFEKTGADSDKLLETTAPSFNAKAASNKRKDSINDQ